MKKATTIAATLFLIFTLSCSNDGDNHFKYRKYDLKYLDPDANCDATMSGTCCDVDGRILVNAGNKYTYTYKGNKATANVTWTVLSGSITIVQGQGTNEAEFYFGKDFTTGQISAKGYVNELYCHNIINISKL
ncbi:hypothetical protein [Flavobacterium poyangense]|uniref:hypothetical protein n=1 Tax=Flavobacterium poyangense TaxID=2204302 RepID=UPI00142379C7|nr:hypothetical protein [Flavobacterium sp. JXAS1]